MGSQEEPEAHRRILPELQPVGEVLDPMVEPEDVPNSLSIRKLDPTSRLRYFGPEGN